MDNEVDLMYSVKIALNFQWYEVFKVILIKLLSLIWVRRIKVEFYCDTVTLPLYASFILI